MCCGKPQPMSGSQQYEIVPHCKLRGHAYVHVAQGILSGTRSAHVQRGLRWSVGHIPVYLCVCLSVTTLAKASLSSTLKQRHVQHWNGLFSVSSLWILEKNIRSNFCFFIGVKCQYANE